MLVSFLSRGAFNLTLIYFERLKLSKLGKSVGPRGEGDSGVEGRRVRPDRPWLEGAIDRPIVPAAMFEEFMAEIFGDELAEPAAANTGDRQTLTYHHVVDALIITVFAWLSLVSGLG